jgi:hypothetical protein
MADDHKPKALWANWYWLFKGPNQNHTQLHPSYRPPFKETRRAKDRRIARRFVIDNS